MDDRIEGFALHLFPGKSGVILQENRLTRQTVSQSDTPFLDLELFRALNGDAKSHRNVIGNVIAPPRQDTALFHGAIDIKNVIGRPASDIDDERAEAFL